jgi:NAD(P)-dependent dehydrogenase (short-subunit alcohol dehydrogenase family)
MGVLDGKVAIVTGAGQGIGRGISLAMAKEGATIGVVEVNPESAERTAKEVEAAGSQAMAIECDVRQNESCERAVAEVVDAFGGVDILVNNAGWGPVKPMLDTTDEDMHHAFEVSVMATLHFMQLCQPYLEARGGGSIINFGSAAGTSGLSNHAAYAAAKEGVRALSTVAAREWGRFGITVNTICPFAASPSQQEWATQHPRMYEGFLAMNPLGRAGDCEEDVGRVAVFLASPSARYLTACTLMVDGGGGYYRM